MKKNKKEEEFFIKKRELGELFDSEFNLDVNLWRGQRRADRGSPVLYPILKSFRLSNGKIRNPDIDTYWSNGEWWVDCTSGGVSLFDVLGVPVSRWDYYRLSPNILIPHGLVITKDSYNRSYEATHYSIRPHWDMPVAKFCLLLDELTKEIIFEN
ncbi:hypothetical protein ACJJI5_18395 [Microbulbifer sp. EKSA008]|uniref:Tse2 family ADP-ribosyltransferase toxin n=1 Tax=Microbulbifer sp. EKSA008 TaxID=3243367 RepID=UPI0040432C2B